MAPSNPRDSYSPFIMDLFIVTGQQQVVQVAAHEFIQSISVELVSEGTWTASIVLFDKDGDFIENLFLAAADDRKILFRWGWDDGSGIEKNPLYQGRIVKYTPDFLADGVIFTLELIPETVVIAALDKKTRSCSEVEKVSDILRNIATERGWITTRDGKSTIEESDGPVGIPLSQKNESDFKFIIEQLLPRAINVAKQAFFFFVDALGIVHFHCAEFQNQFVAAEYIFARNAMGDVIRFAPTEASLFSVLLGGGNAQFTSINSVEGAKLNITTDRKKAFPGGTEQINPDETHFTDLGGKVMARVQLMARTPEELTKLAARQYDILKKRQFKAELEVRGTHAVAVLDYVKVRYVKANGDDHYLSGLFRVQSLRHEVTTGGWVTSMVLFRSGTKAPVTDAPRREGQKKGDIQVRPETQSDVATASTLGVSAAGPGVASRSSLKPVQS